jgi:hypothetical protein
MCYLYTYKLLVRVICIYMQIICMCYVYTYKLFVCVICIHTNNLYVCRRT